VDKEWSLDENQANKRTIRINIATTTTTTYNNLTSVK
jgi:hypothetical protein